ncbi:serine-rich adhesin for platelets-like [Mytilus trossulus]|uniref:serine-rich adhesin for platelets-like n=1 Tax=Mytilus trossulus TaxID=6551 RepID=UPI003003C556
MSTSTDNTISTSTDNTISTSTDNTISTSSNNTISTSSNNTISTSTDNTISTSTDNTISTSTDNTISTSTDNTISTSTDNTISTSTDNTISTSSNNTISTSSNNTISTSTDNTISTSTDNTISTSTDNTISTSTDNTISTSIGKTISTSTDNTTSTSTDNTNSTSGYNTVSTSGPVGTAGKQFFLAFMNDNDLYIEGNVSITLTPATSLPATIHVESSFSNWKTDFTLNPGDVKQLSARKYEVIVMQDLTYQATHGIIITSTSDIVVVAQYISTEIAVSSFVVYPAESIGFDYFAVTDLKGKDGKCVIVCTMNNTLVRIQLSLAANHTLSSTNFRIYRYGEVISFPSMRERETYQMTFTEDITGSRISANKPIAVFCGGNTEEKGFVAEQLLHTQTWGKHYLIPPFLGIKLTIMSRGNKNHVTINSPNCGVSMSLTLNYSGSYVTKSFPEITLPQCVTNISAEKEISVTVYMPLNMDVNPSNLVIPSTDQYTSNTVFVVPETPFQASTTFFVGFVSRIGSGEAVTLDGTLLPDARYHEIAIGVHNITTNRDTFVYIFAYSAKKTDGSNLPGYSYAYAAGMLVQQILQDCIPSLEIIDGVDNDCDGVIDEDPCFTTLNATISNDNSWMFEEDCNANLLSYTTTITESSTTEPRTPTSEPMTSTFEPGTSTAEAMTSTADRETTTMVQISETSTSETTEKTDVTVTNTNGKDSEETTVNSVTTETGNMGNMITTDTAESTQSLISEGSTMTTGETLPDTTLRSTQTNSNQEITRNTVITETDDVDNTITTNTAESTQSLISEGSTVTTDEATQDTTLRSTQTNSYQETTGNSVTTATDDVEHTSQGTDTTDGNTCYCPCSNDALNTEEKIQQRLVDLRTSLRVEKRKLSSSVRKLNSATDDRTSVRYLGISGVIILITVFLFIIMLDSINLIKAIKTRFGKYNLS